jgi:putative ABC transport system substrate-binding protein
LNRRDLLILGSTAIALPLVARAQQKAMPVIGWLHFGSAGSFAYQMPQFFEGLAQGGYVDGQNVAIEYRWAEGQIDRLPALAADLVGRQVNVITAIGPPSVIAAKKATSTIPIVFSAGIDPVAAGLVASLARPGGNITGIVMLAPELDAKRVDVLHQAIPWARRIAALARSNRLEAANLAEMEKAATQIGLELLIFYAATPEEFPAAFAKMRETGVQALAIASVPEFAGNAAALAAQALASHLPTVCEWDWMAQEGCLLGYGPDFAELLRRTADYVVRIFRGAAPGELPMEQPTHFKFTVNLKTATALGLTVPPSILARADEVIE